MVNTKPIKVLVVGQTPPPYGGQAIMVEYLIKSSFGEDVQLFHVPMRFSRSMGEMGTFRLRKLLELIKVVAQIVWHRIRTKTTVLYYPPSGPNLLPVLRDIAILISTRWMFEKTVFHFHAGGLGEFIEQMPTLLRGIARRAFHHPTAAIQLSPFSPSDGEKVKAQKIYVVPNGIEDMFPMYQNLVQNRANSADDAPIILYVGALYEEKGIFDLLQACSILKENGLNFRLKIIGEGNERVKQTMQAFVNESDLTQYVTLLGVRTGDAKWIEFANSDLFCFPSYASFETFGLVILEAMMFALPVVATRWRGTPYLLEDGKNGFLVPVRNPGAIAEKLQVLLLDADLRRKMGEYSRKRFLSEFTIEKYTHRMGKVFLELTGSRKFKM